METIKPGDWIEHYGMRRLVFDVHKGGLDTVSKDGDVSFNNTDAITPLPDCTGWDWHPEPKYRPFKDAWEFVRAVDGQRLALDGRERWVSCVDFAAASALVVRFGPEWLSLKCLLERVKFLDTGEPCGVKL
jgi:hypothetical protein